jgi:hypothetical protein
MDTLSHALWGRGLFGYRGLPKWALFWGAVPDLISFGIYLPQRIWKYGWQWRAPMDPLPDWLYITYDFSHSFVTAFIAIAIARHFSKSMAFAMLAWPFHIVLDFPFHTIAFFPTKFLWPLSDFVIDGIAWSRPEVWFPNLAGILILFIYRYRNSR